MFGTRIGSKLCQVHRRHGESRQAFMQRANDRAMSHLNGKKVVPLRTNGRDGTIVSAIYLR